ncbi:hypothetical protein ACH4TX_16485 [Streptomyces sp. NPDC021098]|uniref:hypothetical protein n=1 Tax=unclassified Streptomyces TaxID=2593676 RepID=UPI00379984D8
MPQTSIAAHRPFPGQGKLIGSDRAITPSARSRQESIEARGKRKRRRGYRRLVKEAQQGQAWEDAERRRQDIRGDSRSTRICRTSRWGITPVAWWHSFNLLFRQRSHSPMTRVLLPRPTASRPGITVDSLLPLPEGFQPTSPCGVILGSDELRARALLHQRLHS